MSKSGQFFGQDLRWSEVRNLTIQLERHVSWFNQRNAASAKCSSSRHIREGDSNKFRLSRKKVWCARAHTRIALIFIATVNSTAWCSFLWLKREFFPSISFWRCSSRRINTHTHNRQANSEYSLSRCSVFIINWPWICVCGLFSYLCNFYMYLDGCRILYSSRHARKRIWCWCWWDEYRNSR